MADTIQTSVAITKSNVFTQVFANIYNLINNRSNIPDPNDSSGNRKFVYIKEPNFSSDNFQGFPLIIVQDEGHSQGNKTADATKAFISDEITIIAMAQDKEADGVGNPSGFATLNTISDYILEVLNNTSNSRTLRSNGIRNKEFSAIDFDWGLVDNKPIFRREFHLRFSNQLRVIA